jgi:hypothetical protein
MGNAEREGERLSEKETLGPKVDLFRAEKRDYGSEAWTRCVVDRQARPKMWVHGTGWREKSKRGLDVNGSVVLMEKEEGTKEQTNGRMRKDGSAEVGRANVAFCLCTCSRRGERGGGDDVGVEGG